MEKKYLFLLKGDELAAELSEKIHSFQEHVMRTGIHNSWRKNQRYYENNFYSNTPGSDILDAGAVGELKALSFNHFRNVIRHTLNQLTAISPAFDVSATSTDVASRRAAKIGKDIVNYYFKVKRVTKKTRKVAEQALVYGDGFVTAEWNPSIGETVAVGEDGKLIKEGDFDFEAISPYDVFYDYTKSSKDDLDWIIFRRRKNKYDLAKVFPNKAKEIIAMDSFYETDLYTNNNSDAMDYDHNTDDIYVYSCYHKPSNVLENGKYVMFIGGQAAAQVLYEGENIYRTLPTFFLSPGNYMESAFGFTEANLLRSPQEVMNIAISAMVTNASSAGANNIWTPTGSNLNLQELVDGMNLIQSDSDKKPEVISFYQDNPGLKDLLGLCNSTIETLSGQNAVVRGNVQEAPNLKSGIAISTVANMAQQYSQALEKSYIEMFEDLSTFILSTLQKVAKTERIIDITGKMQATSANTFTSEDLSGVSRVIVDQSNPITKQPAGKIEIAMELIKLGVITKEEFWDVVDTGNLDNATHATSDMMDFIASVRERLMDGEEIPPMPGINHQLYIKEIHALLYNVEIITKPENQPIMKNIIKTIQQQIDILRNGDEISNLIYGGQSPVPEKINNNQLNIPPSLGGQEATMGQAPVAPGMPPVQ